MESSRIMDRPLHSRSRRHARAETGPRAARRNGQFFKARARSASLLTRASRRPTIARVSRAGESIAGRYQLEREIGSGGMGAVWKARHVALGTPVAIKIIKAEAARYPSARARFAREAVLAAKIKSVHSVKVIDHGEHEGLPFIAMEFLEGESLRQRIDRFGPLSLADTARVVRHVSRALSHAHELGLVHRDIKPENIFITHADDEEVVKVLDFGVVKVTDELARDGVDPTKTGAIVGTPFYVSPEQARGLKTVDFRADLWSLGVVAFECLTGKRPFTAPALGPLIAKIMQGQVPRLTAALPGAGFPPDLDQWLTQALAREPAGRFASAREMAEAFTIASGVGESVPIDSPSMARWASAAPSSRELEQTVALSDAPLSLGDTMALPEEAPPEPPPAPPKAAPKAAPRAAPTATPTAAPAPAVAPAPFALDPPDARASQASRPLVALVAVVLIGAAAAAIYVLAFL
jgi:serine/threonine-protein kinase